MNIKKTSYILVIGITIVTVANLATVLNVDTNFNLELKNIDAWAWDDNENPSGYGGTELRIGMCADGIEDFISCEWEPTLQGEKCRPEDERDCTPGNTPSDPNPPTIDSEDCVKYGHNFYSTSCFQKCHRCSYSKDLCAGGNNSSICVQFGHQLYESGVYLKCRRCTHIEDRH